MLHLQHKEKLLDCSMSDKDRFVKAIRNQLSKKRKFRKNIKNGC